MALYTMGDFHLHFQVEEKSMERFGDEWKDYVNRIHKNCHEILTEEDTIVITGDHSWGHRMHSCEEDLKFISNLPGRKILLRGNHDMFWDPKKTEKLNGMFKNELFFLQNNFYSYKDVALVGTKGYCYEGKDTWEHFLMIREREVNRLEKSFQKAISEGYEKFICFLHFPPTNIDEDSSPFTEMCEKYNVSQVVYSHSHGKARYNDSLKGMVRGIEYHLVSSDYLQFIPKKILD